ncbi:MAG: hypothetical protein EXS67_03890 [Candidatus Margulisbacteria bacterium]|nr:hypothetical protein [Candidatus Margulisiibacteriota bacterium]
MVQKKLIASETHIETPQELSQSQPIDITSREKYFLPKEVPFESGSPPDCDPGNAVSLNRKVNCENQHTFTRKSVVEVVIPSSHNTKVTYGFIVS